MPGPLAQLLDVPSLFYVEAGRHVAVLHKSHEGPEFVGKGSTIQEAAGEALTHKTMWEDKMGEPE